MKPHASPPTDARAPGPQTPSHPEDARAPGSRTTSHPTGVRRRDRAKGDDWVRAFLEAAVSGVLAMVVEGRPHLNSNLFAYDREGHRIYFHTARTGRTPDSAATGGPGTFTSTTRGRFLPASEALEFSVEYAAVMVFGTVRLVTDPAEALQALARVMRKYAPHLQPGRDYRPITVEELRRTSVHALEIEAWSGKEKIAPPDVPGAYVLEEPGPGRTGEVEIRRVGPGGSTPSPALRPTDRRGRSGVLPAGIVLPTHPHLWEL